MLASRPAATSFLLAARASPTSSPATKRSTTCLVSGTTSTPRLTRGLAAADSSRRRSTSSSSEFRAGVRHSRRDPLPPARPGYAFWAAEPPQRLGVAPGVPVLRGVRGGESESGFIRINRAPVSYTHLRAHETGRNLVCRLLLEKKKES